MNYCLICKKKLKNIFISMHTCRCTGIYCHQHIIAHVCDFDYKTVRRQKLKESLVSVIPQKVLKV